MTLSQSSDLLSPLAYTGQWQRGRPWNAIGRFDPEMPLRTWGCGKSMAPREQYNSNHTFVRREGPGSWGGDIGAGSLWSSQQVGKGFPDGSVVKNLPANAGDASLISGSGRYPGGKNGNILQYSCLKNPTNRGAWGCSPWGHKELDTTKRLNTQASGLTFHSVSIYCVPVTYQLLSCALADVEGEFLRALVAGGSQLDSASQSFLGVISKWDSDLG